MTFEETRNQYKQECLDILKKFVLEDFRKPWPGAEWGKVCMGNAFIAAAKDHGATEGEIKAILKLGVSLK